MSVTRSLIPGAIECRYYGECSASSFDRCTTCKNNKKAVRDHEIAKKKKNHYKRLWQ